MSNLFKFVNDLKHVGKLLLNLFVLKFNFVNLVSLLMDSGISLKSLYDKFKSCKFVNSLMHSGYTWK
ncbi:CIC11C00000000070 [Sungouiella intermedia]|uniref:CIC11C00000000070 n=1 Tax=Sungouiella intermedia TaxID=45354 RepID=A0A1L0D9K1_9ASCO|nr:CIC11C00000000070 [[Candida] intermedia]